MNELTENQRQAFREWWEKENELADKLPSNSIWNEMRPLVQQVAYAAYCAGVRAGQKQTAGVNDFITSAKRVVQLENEVNRLSLRVVRYVMALKRLEGIKKQRDQVLHLLQGGTLTEKQVIKSGLGVGVLIEHRRQNEGS